MMRATILPVAAGSIAADVPELEYRRLLEWPRRVEPMQELEERARQARAWYANRGRPFLAARRVELRSCEARGGAFATRDVLGSEALTGWLRAGRAHALWAIAASAGPEVADESARAFADGRPDEGYFLDRFAAAVAETLVQRASAILHSRSLRPEERLLTHLSPGYGHWDLGGQHRLMAFMSADGSPAATGSREVSLGPVTLLESGALRPPHSLLAVLGVTRWPAPDGTAIPCRRCELDPCRFRRARHRSHSLVPAAP